jgi:hypothetical protein
MTRKTFKVNCLVSFIERRAARETVKQFDAKWSVAGCYNILQIVYDHLKTGTESSLRNAVF